MISGYIAKLSKVSSESKGRIKYKESFEKALEFVNNETQKLLMEFANSTKIIRKHVDYIFSIEKQTNEGIIDDIKIKLKQAFNFIKNIVNKITNQIKKTNKAQDDLIKQCKLLYDNYTNFWLQ